MLLILGNIGPIDVRNCIHFFTKYFIIVVKVHVKLHYYIVDMHILGRLLVT